MNCDLKWMYVIAGYPAGVKPPKYGERTFCMSIYFKIFYLGSLYLLNVYTKTNE